MKYFFCCFGCYTMLSVAEKFDSVKIWKDCHVMECTFRLLFSECFCYYDANQNLLMNNSFHKWKQLLGIVQLQRGHTKYFPIDRAGVAWEQSLSAAPSKTLCDAAVWSTLYIERILYIGSIREYSFIAAHLCLSVFGEVCSMIKSSRKVIDFN